MRERGLPRAGLSRRLRRPRARGPGAMTTVRPGRPTHERPGGRRPTTWRCISSTPLGTAWRTTSPLIPLRSPAAPHSAGP